MSARDGGELKSERVEWTGAGRLLLRVTGNMVYSGGAYVEVHPQEEQ